MPNENAGAAPRAPGPAAPGDLAPGADDPRVREVAERVYRLLAAELRLERARGGAGGGTGGGTR